MKRYLPQEQHDIPLVIKFETRSIWPLMKEQYGLCASGAAIGIALHDASHFNRMVSYSRDLNFYSRRQCHPMLSYRKVIGAVSNLDAQGLIIHHKQCPGGRGWQSAMAGTPEFLRQIGAFADGLPLARPRNLVLLRDKDGRPLDVPNNRAVNRMGKRVAEINEALCSADIRSHAGAFLGAPVVRIFNRDMSRGGRLYGLGASWQNIPSEDRQKILINGEGVGELDYSTLHPSLLYGEAGSPPPLDCYDIGNWPRPLVKKGLLVLINAPSERNALLCLAHCPEMDALGPETVDKAIEMARCLIGDIKAAHRPIAKFFHKDTGARLMRKDSDLAADILTTLIRQGIVSLPVHDSFVVAKRHLPELESVMHNSAASMGLPNPQVETR